MRKTGKVNTNRERRHKKREKGKRVDGTRYRMAADKIRQMHIILHFDFGTKKKANKTQH